MSPVQFAIAEIRSVIPDEILELAFIPKTKYKLSRSRFTPKSIDSQIYFSVINERVRRHVDSQGAKQITIPLSGLKFEEVEMGNGQAWTCHIPKRLTGGRTITHVISVHVGMVGTGAGFLGGGSVSQFGLGVSTRSTNNACGNDIHLASAREIIDASKPMDMNFTSNVYLIDENTIMVEDRMPISNLELRCQVSSDEEFSFIQGAHVAVFAELCLLATQAYIYKKLSIVSDKAILDGGMDLGSVKEWIDKFADSNEQFNELVKGRWAKIQKMSDKPRHNRWLNMKGALVNFS